MTSDNVLYILRAGQPRLAQEVEQRAQAQEALE